MSKRFTVLDSFRGLFAFIVAIFHYKASGMIGQLALFRQGDYFVDFFFVLSGFIIYHTYAKLTVGQPQRRFMRNRLLRLYPLHIVMLCVFLLMEIGKYLLYSQGLFKSPVFERNNLMTFIENILFMQSFSITSAGWNYPSWSISAEMVTYLIFCLLIVYINRLPLLGRIGSFLAISLLSLGLLYGIKGNLDVKMTNTFSMVRCMYGFFAGCFTYEIYRLVREKKLSKITCSVFEITILLTSLIATAYLPESFSFVLPICFVLCVLIFAIEGGILSIWLNNKLLHKIGELSYSIYMTHAAIAIVFEIALGVLKINSTPLLSVVLLLYLVTVFQISRLTHSYIEVKFKNILQKRKTVTPSETIAELNSVSL